MKFRASHVVTLGVAVFYLLLSSPVSPGRASTVSAADPIVVGIIALLLEMDPTLDAAEIKELLHAGARADSSTGALPNPRRGYGKVDALASLDLLHERLTRLRVSDITPAGFRISSRGQNGKTYVFEKSTNLTDWSPLSTILAGTNIFGLDVTNAESNNFFRLTR